MSKPNAIDPLSSQEVSGSEYGAGRGCVADWAMKFSWAARGSCGGRGLPEAAVFAKSFRRLPVSSKLNLQIYLSEDR